VGKLYEVQGLHPVPMTRAQFAKYIDDEHKKWVGVMRDAKIPRRTLGGR